MLEIQDLQRQSFKNFGPREEDTWRTLFSNLNQNRKTMAHDIFAKGVGDLGMSQDHIPSLKEINEKLFKKTGWKGIPVEGLEAGNSFYPALARREFPIGNFIRDRDSLGYTPAPDVFHDLYGHIPFYLDQAYADFCENYGKMVTKYLNNEKMLQKFERFFWFAVEFPLIETPKGRRIFGAGILSSHDESIYSLSDRPEVIPFDISKICEQDYRIDQIQPKLFVLKSPKQLYSSVSLVEDYVVK